MRRLHSACFCDGPALLVPESTTVDKQFAASLTPSILSMWDNLFDDSFGPPVV